MLSAKSQLAKQTEIFHREQLVKLISHNTGTSSTSQVSPSAKSFEFWPQRGHRTKPPRRNFQGRDEAVEFTAGISSLSVAITPVGTEIWARAPPPRAVRGRGREREDTAERPLEAHYSLSEAR